MNVDLSLLLDLVAIMLTVAYLGKLTLEESAGRGLSIRHKIWSICSTTKRSLIGQQVVVRASAGR